MRKSQINILNKNLSNFAKDVSVTVSTTNFKLEVSDRKEVLRHVETSLVAS